MSKYGVRILPSDDGGFRLVFDSTPYGRALERHHAPAGDALRQTFVAKYDENHNRQFFKDKKIDQYARIQSFKEQCLIENIIKRCTGGDYSGLNRVQGMYGDISQMPMDPRSAHELLIRAREVYEKIGEEEKQRDFSGSFETFLGTFGDNQALDRYLKSRVKTETKTEVPVDGKE